MLNLKINKAYFIYFIVTIFLFIHTNLIYQLQYLAFGKAHTLYIKIIFFAVSVIYFVYQAIKEKKIEFDLSKLNYFRISYLEKGDSVEADI